MRRGEVVTVALQGDLGKPRPALVMQSDQYAAHPSLVVLPITSSLVEASRLRPRIGPNAANGLQVVSQIMVDKVQSVARRKVGARIGTIDDGTMIDVERALTALLGLG